MNKIVDRNAYLSFAKNITSEETKLMAEYGRWLPKKIIDCHAHCNLESHVKYISDQAFNHMLSTFPSFNLEESAKWNKLFHPNKIVLSLRFPIVFHGIDHKKANTYLLNESPKCDRIALYGLPDNNHYTIKMLGHPRVSALKMYHSYTTPPATKIYDYYPKEILSVAQQNNVPVILHPPTEISLCIKQILKLIDDFPALKICIAHIGLAQSLTKKFENALKSLSQYPLLVFDTALVTSADVIKATINIVGADKLMFGSDAPLNLIKSITYHHSQYGWRLAVKYPYHWANQDEQKQYGHLANNATHDHWRILKAIKSAINSLPNNVHTDVKQKIFYLNAKSFYRF